MRKKKAADAVFEEQPGYFIRRLQQIAVAIFLEETQAFGITPVQFAALSAASRDPGLDQRTLAATIGFDTSTIGGVIDRLERRGLIRRETSPADRRVRLLHVTDAGASMIEAVVPAMLQAQQRILAPLAASDRPLFLSLLEQVVEGNNAASRAPSEG